MAYEIVHTIGSTVYFVFFLLFLWICRVPRTNPGAGWWAAAMLFALSARLVFLFLLIERDASLTISAYAALNVLEKFCLVVGLVRFFGLPLRMHPLCVATLVVEIWIFLAWASEAPPLVRGLGVAAFNAGVLSYVAWVAYQKRGELDSWLMSITALVSLLLALHWATVFVIIEYVPGWLTQGFLLGTALVLVQYFLLLAAVLRSFEKRLLEAESKALDMAFEDPLTGLSNKRYMNSLFENALILATRPHQLVAIVCIDLDNFKPINDRAGHRVGDEVLKTVAARLRKATRSTDICARVGGDEFVAICTQLEQQEQVDHIVRKLLRELTAVIVVDGREYALGASIGISLYPLHGNSLPTLLEYADRAMYQVKSSGKNNYRIHVAESAA
jgi:diguanylate cyclase (GGDEF)-like protein